MQRAEVTQTKMYESSCPHQLNAAPEVVVISSLVRRLGPNRRGKAAKRLKKRSPEAVYTRSRGTGNQETLPEGGGSCRRRSRNNNCHRRREGGDEAQTYFPLFPRRKCSHASATYVASSFVCVLGAKFKNNGPPKHGAAGRGSRVAET